MAVETSRRVLEVKEVGNDPVTLPEGVIERLGLQSGDRVAFVEVDGRIVVQGEPRSSLEDVIGSIKVSGRLLTDDELDRVLEEAMEPELREKYGRIFKGQG